MTKYLNEWSNTAGSNNFTVPDGWPEGMTSSQINNTARETLAVISRWEKDNNGSVVTSGTQPAYVVTLNQSSIAAYYDGLMLALDIHATNAGGAPTVNVNSIGAKSIVHADGTAVATSELLIGMKVVVVYDGTNFQLLSPTTDLNAKTTNASVHLPEGSAPSTAASEGALYTKDTSGQPELFYREESDGDEVQLTSAGSINVTAQSLPKNYLTGLTISNDTDADHDIAVAVGECRDIADSVDMVFSSILTKQIDATWAAGDDAGGMEDGDTVGADELFYVHLLSSADGTTVDAGFDTSATAVNLLADTAVIAAGLTKYRPIGAVATDSSSNIIAFTQVGDYFRYTGDVIQDITDSTITNQTFETGTLTAPRYSISHIYANYSNATNTQFSRVWLRYTGAAETAVIQEAVSASSQVGAGTLVDGGAAQILLDGSSQFQYAAEESGGATTLSIRTYGFEMLTRSSPI